MYERQALKRQDQGIIEKLQLVISLNDFGKQGQETNEVSKLII